MVKVMKIMVYCIRALSAPKLAACHHRPTSLPSLLDTHRQVCVSLLWGHCSFLLGPGVHKVLSVPSKSLFPQSCISSGSSMLGLMATSSKRAYAIPRSAPFSVQFSSIAQSCPTLCNPINCSTPGLPVHHQLPEFTQTHVH